jgi:protein-S-isoprenylcysteine O-methyltransferase Ste14
MPNLPTSLEIDLRWLCGIAGLVTLAYALYSMLSAQSRPTGHYTGAARVVLRTRYLVIATLLFLFFGYILWRPLPIQLPLLLQLFVSILGAVIFITSLVLYLWGLRTLGENFNASSGFGVRLHQAHRLVTHGPYAFIRHPMYLGVILAGWSGLLLYRTWTMLCFAVIMLGLTYRARREDQALKESFGRQWETYQRNVPAWFPRIGTLLRTSRKKPH